MQLEEAIDRAQTVLSQADAVFITAGAGMGVDSGLPDFRGNEGFWNAYPPIARLGKSFAEMANPEWFFRKPELAWAFYGHRLNLYRATVPHVGYQRLLDVGRNKPGGYFVFTSNVDGQFQIAGFDDHRIEECHGSIHHFQCTQPCTTAIWDASDIQVEVDEEIFEATAPLPQCSKCGEIARPNILMFGDWHWIHHRTAEQGTRLTNWLRNIRSTAMKLAIIEMGAGEYVPTVRYKSENIASYSDATLIRINPRDYNVPAGHISIPLGAKEGVLRICMDI